VTEALGSWGGPADVARRHADGLLHLAAGSTVAARADLEAAIAGWDAIGRVWESTWARLDLAMALVRAGRHADALPLLAAVRAVAERLRSDPLLRRAEELAGVVRSRGAIEEPWRPLTVREFEVAGLVAEGMTNPEIAAELGLSPKTVSAHLEHILAKLGAMRRAEVAAWVSTIRPMAGVGGGRR
jgi:DNA-binding CsgD family transcriptional regulator